MESHTHTSSVGPQSWYQTLWCWPTGDSTHIHTYRLSLLSGRPAITFRLRSTQPSTIRGTVNWVSAYELS